MIKQFPLQRDGFALSVNGLVQPIAFPGHPIVNFHIPSEKLTASAPTIDLMVALLQVFNLSITC